MIYVQYKLLLTCIAYTVHWHNYVQCAYQECKGFVIEAWKGGMENVDRRDDD